MANHAVKPTAARALPTRSTSLDDSSSDHSAVETKPYYQPIARVPTHIDEVDAVNLPFRTLSNNANLEEYNTETIDGQILREVRSNATAESNVTN